MIITSSGVLCREGSCRTHVAARARGWLPRMTAQAMVQDRSNRTKSSVEKKRRRVAKDLSRALSCSVCAAAGIINRPPVLPAKHQRTPRTNPIESKQREDTPASPDAKKDGCAKKSPRLTDGQARFLRRGWEYLATARPGDNPDSRLLALLCLLRAARSGQANLVAQDVRGLRVADPCATVTALTSTGWLDTSPEAILVATPEMPALCSLPDFVDPVNPWGVGKTVRARASGWTSRALAHKMLRKKPNAARITAVYLTAHATPAGTIEFSSEHLAAACALTTRPEMVAAIKTLLEVGWLADCRATGKGTLCATLSEEGLKLAPAPAPPSPDPNSLSARRKQTANRSASKETELATADEAKQLVEGRETELVRWVEEFRAEHGHGPSWSCMATSQRWPYEYGQPRTVCKVALRLLYARGWLAGLHVPYGMRPGPRYQYLKRQNIDHATSEPATLSA